MAALGTPPGDSIEGITEEPAHTPFGGRIVHVL